MHVFERFTGPADQVMCLAYEEADRLRHDYVGPEHVLAGLGAAGNPEGNSRADCSCGCRDAPRDDLHATSYTDARRRAVTLIARPPTTTGKPTTGKASRSRRITRSS